MPTLGQQLDGSPPRLLAAEVEVGLNRLDQLPAHREQRVQAGQRILEDGGDLPAAQAPQPLRRQVVDPASLESDLAAADAAPGRSSSPMIAVPVSDFPAPDSPTTPSISPAATLNDTRSTAVSRPRRVSKTTLRSRTPRAAEPNDDRLVT